MVQAGRITASAATVTSAIVMAFQWGRRRSMRLRTVGLLVACVVVVSGLSFVKSPTYLTHQSTKTISKLDESCISDPKSRNIGLDLAPHTVQLAVSDFGSEMHDSSNFKLAIPGFW
jgi:hypothetical protein